MIKELLTKNSIAANVEASDWQEAVRKAGMLLVDSGCVEETYVDGMVEVVKEYGPYIVVLPGLALAHARPEKGAKKIGLALITLKNPVEFGSETFDPVKVVFALSAVDNHSHLQLLQEMAVLFENEENIKKIIDCKTNDEIEKFINEIVDSSAQN